MPLPEHPGASRLAGPPPHRFAPRAAHTTLVVAAAGPAQPIRRRHAGRRHSKISFRRAHVSAIGRSPAHRPRQHLRFSARRARVGDPRGWWWSMWETDWLCGGLRGVGCPAARAGSQKWRGSRLDTVQSLCWQGVRFARLRKLMLTPCFSAAWRRNQNQYVHTGARTQLDAGLDTRRRGRRSGQALRFGHWGWHPGLEVQVSSRVGLARVHVS